MTLIQLTAKQCTDMNRNFCENTFKCKYITNTLLQIHKIEFLNFFSI